MEEKYDKKTKKIGNHIEHYTCNAPPLNILEKFNIMPIGDKYGLQPREVVKIPINLLKKRGLYPGDKEDFTIECEILLKNLKNKR